MPRMESLYDPPYDSDYPPVDCSAYYVPRTTKVLHYMFDEDRRLLTVF